MQLSRIGPIALEQPLGGAADSNVLRGHHVERNMALAVKLLPRELVNQAMRGDAFAADVKALTHLVHPNIVRVLGGAMESGQPYLAMELVEGESLRSRLDRLGRLPWETTVDLADAICLALDHAHKQGFVHGRLTPSRILLTPDGGVKLIGFDCAWSDRDEVLGLRLPCEEAHYLAQEVFKGKASGALPTVDLFSLGVILYECLTGKMPWPCKSVKELVQIRREHPAPRASATVLECPVWLDVLLARLLEVRRRDRIQSAEETHRAIVAAKLKVAQGAGAAQQALAGKQGALALKGDRQELRRLRKQAAPREVEPAGPFYERAWFLALCLAGLGAAGTWVMWPPSEEELFAKAQPLMNSDSSVDWRRAEDEYIKPLLARFPDTTHRAEIEEFESRFAMHRAQERIKNIERFGRAPASEVDRLYAEAERYERFGDRVTAWQKYEGLLNLFPQSDDIDQQAVIDLARQAVARIKSQAQDSLDLAAVVDGKLAAAQKMIDQGQRLAGRQILDSIVLLYGGNKELASQVEQARELIRGMK